MKSTEATNLVLSNRLAMQFGTFRADGKLRYSKEVIGVSSFEDAGRKWEAIRDSKSLRASNSPIVVIVDTATSEQVAKISYNGRIWDASGAEIPRIDNRGYGKPEAIEVASRKDALV